MPFRPTPPLAWDGHDSRPVQRLKHKLEHLQPGVERQPALEVRRIALCPVLNQIRGPSLLLRRRLQPGIFKVRKPQTVTIPSSNSLLRSMALSFPSPPPG